MFEASGGAGKQACDLNLTVYSFDSLEEMKYLIYPFYSLWYQKKRGTKCLQKSTGSGESKIG